MKNFAIRRSKLALVALLAVAALAPQAAAAQGSHAQKIAALARFYTSYNRFNGALLVAEGGRVIYREGLGWANMEWDVPNRADTKFLLGSVTKQFTAMLTMQLVQAGRLDLDGTVSRYLPYYRTDIGNKITIRELLDHTSGLPNYLDIPGFIPNELRNHYTVEAFVKKYCSGDLQFAPGTRYEYSNSGYYLLGAIIERVTGKSYAENLREKIFRPAGMKDSGFYDETPIIKRRAAGYLQTLGGYVNAPFQDMSIPFSAGAIYSTVGDLYRWDQALYGNRLLGQRYKKMMFTPNLGGYGFGWRIGPLALGTTKDSVPAIYHGGDIFGFDTTIIRVPGKRDLIVILDNAMQRHDIDDMSQRILGILFDKPYGELKPPIAEILRRTIVAHGIQAALAQYKLLKREHPGDYDFSERELNGLGYQLLGDNRPADAIAIFQLNAEAYPASFNVYDSLGEAYRDAGRRADAILNYERSLKLNPKNENASEQLRRLRRL